MEETEVEAAVSQLPQSDEKTLEIHKDTHNQMAFDDPVVDEDINWSEVKTSADPVDTMIEKVYLLKDKICKKFKKSKEVVQDLLPGRQ